MYDRVQSDSGGPMLKRLVAWKFRRACRTVEADDMKEFAYRFFSEHWITPAWPAGPDRGAMHFRYGELFAIAALRGLDKEAAKGWQAAQIERGSEAMA
jgi:hypothetical protein